MSDQTAIDREQERRIIDVLSSRSDTLSRDAHRALMAAARERDEAVDQIGVQAATVAELNRGLLALRAEQARLRAALLIAVQVAKDAQLAWDDGRDSRVGKYLAALAGYLKGYRADIDRMHAALAGAPERQHSCGTCCAFQTNDIEALIAHVKVCGAPEGTQETHGMESIAPLAQRFKDDRDDIGDLTPRAVMARWILRRLAPQGTAAEPAAEDELLPPKIEWDLARAGEPLATKVPAPPADPLHAALRAMVEDWRAMAKLGQENIVPGDDCAIARWTTAEMLADDVEALLSAPAVPSSPTPEASDWWGVIGPCGIPCLFGKVKSDADEGVDTDERVALFRVQEIQTRPKEQP